VCGEKKPSQDLDPDVLPLCRRSNVQRQHGKVERALGHVAALKPALPRLLQEGVLESVIKRFFFFVIDALHK